MTKMENQQDAELEAEFDVLLEIDGSRRQLKVTFDIAFTVIERELRRLGLYINVVPLGMYISDQQERTKTPYVLQRWCSKFKTFIDVTDKSQFIDRIRLTVSGLARPGSSSIPASNSEVQHKVALYMIVILYNYCLY